MSQQLMNGKQQFLDGNGTPLASGSVAFYEPGTTTPINTWSNQNLTTLNSNPVILDANGEAVIWGADGEIYQQVVSDSSGNVVWSEVIGTQFQYLPISAINYISPLSGAISRSLTSKLNDVVSILDFGADPTGTNDSTSAIQAAINECQSTGKSLYIPGTDNYYLTLSTLDISSGIKIYGDGVTPYTDVTGGTSANTRGAGSWIYANHTNNAFSISPSTPQGSGVLFRDMGIFRNQTVPSTGAFTPINTNIDIYVNNCDVTIQNVYLLNPYIGVQLVNGAAGRLNISGLYGQPLSVGIDINESYDDVIIDKVHFWSYWSSAASVLTYLENNATAISLGYAVDPVFSNIVAFGYQIGFSFYQTTVGATGRMIASNIDFNAIGWAIYVAAGVTGANAVFTNINAGGSTGWAHYAVVDGGTNSFFVLNNITIFDYESSGGIYESGSGCTIQLNNINSANTGTAVVCSGSTNLVQISNQIATGLTSGAAPAVSVGGGVIWGMSGPGYEISSTGHIKQWGTVTFVNPTGGAFSSVTVDYPIPFVSQVTSAKTSMSSLPNTGYWCPAAEGAALDAMVVAMVCQTSYTGSVTVNWEVEGY